MSESPRLEITQAKLAFVLAIVGVLTLGWNAVSYLKAGEAKDSEQDRRITYVEDAGKRFEQGIDRLTGKTDELKESIVRLTTVMEQNAIQKRANYEDRTLPGRYITNIARGDQ